MDSVTRRGLATYGVVGRDVGHNTKQDSEVIVTPTVDTAHVTARAESPQALIWDRLVLHPDLNANESKLEGFGLPEDTI